MKYDVILSSGREGTWWVVSVIFIVRCFNVLFAQHEKEENNIEISFHL